MSVAPPPLPIKTGTPVWKKYLFFGAMLVPAFFFHVFNSLVLAPKAKRLWIDAGETISGADWIMDIGRNVTIYFQAGLVLMVCVIAALELYTRWWASWRTGFLAIMTLAFNTFVFIEVTHSATTMGLAAPVVVGKAKQQLEKEAVPK